MCYLAEKLAAGTNSSNKASKEVEELDQVAGNVEDEIGERIAAVRETELLYGPESLLAVYGPLLVHVCGSPHKFKVGRTRLFSAGLFTVTRTRPSVRRRHCPLPSSSASAHNSVTNTIASCSRSSRPRETRVSVAISSSRWATLPSPLVASSMRTATSSTRVFRIQTWSSRRTRSWYSRISSSTG